MNAPLMKYVKLISVTLGWVLSLGFHVGPSVDMKMDQLVANKDKWNSCTSVYQFT